MLCLSLPCLTSPRVVSLAWTVGTGRGRLGLVMANTTTASPASLWGRVILHNLQKGCILSIIHLQCTKGCILSIVYLQCYMYI